MEKETNLVFTKFLLFWLDPGDEYGKKPEDVKSFDDYMDLFLDHIIDNGEDPQLPFTFDYSGRESVRRALDELESKTNSGMTFEAAIREIEKKYSNAFEKCRKKNFASYLEWLKESKIDLVLDETIDYDDEHGGTTTRYVFSYYGSYYEFTGYHYNGGDDYTPSGEVLNRVERHERTVTIVEYY